MTKRTPLERREKLRLTFEAAWREAINAEFAEQEKMVDLLSDPALPWRERLKRLKVLQSWPRTVLGIYEAELPIAQKEEEERPPPVAGETRSIPSIIAQEHRRRRAPSSSSV
jgi:hypothetical protein